MDTDTKSVINSSGLSVFNDGDQLASFGSTSVIGSDTDKVTINSSGITLRENNVNTITLSSGAVTIGQTGNSKSRVNITSNAVKIINRDSGGGDTTMLEFNSSGLIEADDYLIEKTRLFGTGVDETGTVTLTTGTSQAAKTSDSNSSNIFTNSATNVWTMQQDTYVTNLTVNSSVTLKTNGFRLYVKSTLTNNGTIENNGSNGSAGQAGQSEATSTGGAGGAGGAGGTLCSGSAGAAGGNGNASNKSFSGGAGGGAGGGGGIVFIFARNIAGTGNIQSNGGNGGDGGQGGAGNSGGGTNSGVFTGGMGVAAAQGGGGGASNAVTTVSYTHLTLPTKA